MSLLPTPRLFPIRPRPLSPPLAHPPEAPPHRPPSHHARPPIPLPSHLPGLQRW
jgi:hypothetical protein